MPYLTSLLYCSETGRIIANGTEAEKIIFTGSIFEAADDVSIEVSEFQYAAIVAKGNAENPIVFTREPLQLPENVPFLLD